MMCQQVTQSNFNRRTTRDSNLRQGVSCPDAQKRQSWFLWPCRDNKDILIACKRDSWSFNLYLHLESTKGVPAFTFFYSNSADWKDEKRNNGQSLSRAVIFGPLLPGEHFTTQLHSETIKRRPLKTSWWQRKNFDGRRRVSIDSCSNRCPFRARTPRIPIRVLCRKALMNYTTFCSVVAFSFYLTPTVSLTHTLRHMRTHSA